MHAKRVTRCRRGQSLVEFAVVALVTYMLLAAIITFGFLFFAAQVAQTAADVGARELSRMPLPPIAQFEEVMALEQVRKRIYTRDLLVTPVPSPDELATWPVLNQQLYPLMIFDQELRMLRYPGTLVTGADTDDGYDVIIPVLAADGSVTWVQPVEEVDTETSFVGGPPGDDAGDNPDPFPIASPQMGLVALRVNYPFQSAVMTAYMSNPTGNFEPTVGNPIPATDSYGEVPYGSLTGRGLIDDHGTAETSDDTYAGPNGGNYGLGVHGAMSQAVRPFRRVISAQAIYRREIFQ